MSKNEPGKQCTACEAQLAFNGHHYFCPNPNCIIGVHNMKAGELKPQRTMMDLLDISQEVDQYVRQQWPQLTEPEIMLVAFMWLRSCEAAETASFHQAMINKEKEPKK